MPFVKDIENYKSLSIIGLEKNTGKTECLNYVLSRLSDSGKTIALTSIGIDGENKDQVKQTHKPEIDVYQGMMFVTSELHYKSRKLVSEILDVSKQSTSLGRLVTAKAITTDKVMISGPANNAGLIDIINNMSNFGVDITIVDGALSRKSLASPTVTEAMILATGAALSSNITQLVFKTKYVFDLIALNETNNQTKEILFNIREGIWSIDNDNNITDLNISSVMMIEKVKDRLFEAGNRIYVSGAITDNFLNFLKNQKQINETEIIVRDFTRIFAQPEVFYSYIKRGGKIKVLQKTKLVAITINPVSPDGYVLNSEELKKALEEKLGLPVYDVKKIKN